MLLYWLESTAQGFQNKKCLICWRCKCLMQACLPEVPDVEATICSTWRQYGLIMRWPLDLEQPVKELN